MQYGGLWWVVWGLLWAQGSNAFSLGMRSTASLFSHEGAGLGVGGQFRVQLGPRVNTEWFADYITIQEANLIKSVYGHIGWSVLYYVYRLLTGKRGWYPYIMAGHCFDYNQKSLIADPTRALQRWGSAVQGGGGFHVFLTQHFDVSLSLQYMIHLTGEIHHTQGAGGEVILYRDRHVTLQGHTLLTLSLNYRVFSYGL